MSYKAFDRKGNGYVLEPTSAEYEPYFEVYSYSEDELHGEYIGDFETPQKIGSTEFERDFNHWLENNC